MPPATRSTVGVLVVEGHVAVRMGVLRLLDNEAGFESVAVGTGEDALEAATDKHFDIAVVDYELADGEDGLTLTRDLRCLPQPPRVLIYSAYADTPLAALAMVAGADGVLNTARLGVELSQAVRDILNGRTRWPAVPAPIIATLGLGLPMTERTAVSHVGRRRRRCRCRQRQRSAGDRPGASPANDPRDTRRLARTTSTPVGRRCLATVVRQGAATARKPGVSVFVWSMIGIAVWHFTIFVPAALRDARMPPRADRLLDARRSYARALAASWSCDSSQDRVAAPSSEQRCGRILKIWKRQSDARGWRLNAPAPHRRRRRWSAVGASVAHALGPRCRTPAPARSR